MIRTIVGVCLLASTPCIGIAAEALAFEVASIKPAAPQQPGRFQISMGGDPGRIDYQGVNLRMLIERAYTIKTYQISGPDWLDSERFDVAAKLPDGAKQSDVPRMLQALLAERFKLAVHHDQKTLPVYAIVVKDASKMKKNEGDPTPMKMQMSPKGRKFEGTGTVDALAGMLARMVDRPVVDQSELKGNYELKLEWTPDDREGGMKGMVVAAGAPLAGGGGGGEAHGGDAESSAPSLFAAIQEQLGLKLESRKAPVDILVIDSMEKSPSQN